jgi:myosin-5
MQAMVSSLEIKIDETEKKYEEASKISEERLKQALDAETKIIQLKTAMQRWVYWSRFFCNVGHRL